MKSQHSKHYVNKQLTYSRGSARCAMSVEMLSTAAQLYQKSLLKSL